MSQVQKWFDRRFAVPYPVSLVPNLLTRLRGTPARLEDIVRDCSHRSLVALPREGWSAQETAGHLLDLESLWLARVENYIAGSEHLAVADLTNEKTMKASHNARPIGQILTELRSARERLMTCLDDVTHSAYA